ncbi:MAG: metallophosphoesterase [Lachnospiraceae bacterium]|nr:metallophosphoesterase [Lachnospiraceae bacterium]
MKRAEKGSKKIKEVVKRYKKEIAVILALIFTIWMLVTNLRVEVNETRVFYESLPAAFDGFRMVQISDFHNAKFGKGNQGLVQKVKSAAPDIIVITGDFIDSRRTDIAVSLAFAKELTEIAPCYYVTGNHESRLKEEELGKLEQGLLAAGVVVLRDKKVLIEKNGEQMALVGIEDPDFSKDWNEITANVMREKIDALTEEDCFTIVLSHRPEYYEAYKDAKVNLVLAGHAHGGQIRLPFVGGVIAPHQGLFPKYDAGLYREDEFALMVSRGIGNSLCPVRVNNPPEIVVLELHREVAE